MDNSEKPQATHFSLSLFGVLHGTPDDGSGSLRLSTDCLDLLQHTAEAFLAWPSAELHPAHYLPRPPGGDKLPTHILAVAHHVSSSHLAAVSRTATLLVLSFSEARGLLHGMNIMCFQLPSQAPVGLLIALASPQPGQ